MGTCRLTGEFIGGRLWRLGAVAVTIYELLFAHARYRQGLASNSLWESGICASTVRARVSHGLTCTRGHRVAAARHLLCCFRTHSGVPGAPRHSSSRQYAPMSSREELQSAKNKLAAGSLSIPALGLAELSSLLPSSPPHMT